MEVHTFLVIIVSDELYSSGNVVGCAIDFDKKEITYTLNGTALGVAFAGITIPSDGVYPCISVARRERVLVNFGKNDFQYPIPGFLGLHSQLGSDGLKKLEKVFEKYKQLGQQEGDSASSDSLQPMGLTKFCEDLEIDPDGVDFLMLSWKLNTKTPFEVSRFEFLGGFDQMNASDISSIKKRLQDLRNRLQDSKLFRRFYQFCFDFVKATPQAKQIDMETATATWSTVLPGRFQLLPQWLEYLGTVKTRAVSRDTWKMILEFAEKIGNDIKQYDPDGILLTRYGIECSHSL